MKEKDEYVEFGKAAGNVVTAIGFLVAIVMLIDLLF